METSEDIEQVTAEVLDSIEDDAEEVEAEAEETQNEGGEEGEGGAEEAPEEPGADAAAMEALEVRIDEIEVQIALLRDSISALVENGMVICEDDAESVDPIDDDSILLEDLDYD